MMTVKLISRMAGAEGNFAPGSIITVDDIKGESLVNGGYAILLERDCYDDITPVTKEDKPPKKTPKNRKGAK